MWLMCCLPHKELFSAGQGELEKGRAPAKRVSWKGHLFQALKAEDFRLIEMPHGAADSCH